MASFKALKLTVFYIWMTLPSITCKILSFTSFRSLIKCHFLREAFPDLTLFNIPSLSPLLSLLLTLALIITLYLIIFIVCSPTRVSAS